MAQLQGAPPPKDDALIQQPGQKVSPVWWRWFTSVRDAIVGLEYSTLALGSVGGGGGTVVKAAGVNQVTATLSGGDTFTISGGMSGQLITFTLSYVTAPQTATFSTGFKSTGTLTTVAAKIVSVTFVHDGTTFNEIARQSTGV